MMTVMVTVMVTLMVVVVMKILVMMAVEITIVMPRKKAVTLYHHYHIHSPADV
jgi:hypothetical protein